MQSEKTNLQQMQLQSTPEVILPPDDPKDILPKRPIFTRTDCIFSILFFIISFFYVDWVNVVPIGAGTTLFAALFLLSCIGYGFFNHCLQTKESICYFAVSILAAATFFLFDDKILKLPMFGFFLIITFYWIAVFTKRRIPDENGNSRKMSRIFIWDIWNQFFIVPFSNFSAIFGGFQFLSRKEKKDSSFLYAIMGIIICFPVIMVILFLLSSADFAFEYVISSIREIFTIRLKEYFFKILFAIPVGCYFFGLLFGNVKGYKTDTIKQKTISSISKGVQILPSITINTILTMINLVYVFYFISQSAYLFSAFRNLLPTALTYAQYARRGFFQLCLIAGINFIVLLACDLFLERKENGKGSRIIYCGHKIILCIFTMLFIATALSKMLMYIHYYGLTQLRVYSSWFMIVLFLIFLIAVLRQRFFFRGAKSVFLVITISFLALCYLDVDSTIAKYNIQRFEQGSLSSFSPMEYRNYSAGAVVYFAKLYDKIPDDGVFRTPPSKGFSALTAEECIQLKKDLFQLITRTHEQSRTFQGNWYNGDFRVYNLQAIKAEQIVQKIAGEKK